MAGSNKMYIVEYFRLRFLIKRIKECVNLFRIYHLVFQCCFYLVYLNNNANLQKFSIYGNIKRLKNPFGCNQRDKVKIHDSIRQLCSDSVLSTLSRLLLCQMRGM